MAHICRQEEERILASRVTATHRHADAFGHSGFTLVELMVAMILFALVSTAIYGSYSAIVRTSDGLYEHLDRNDEIRSCLERIRADIAGILITPLERYSPPDQREESDPYQLAAAIDNISESVRFEFASMTSLPISGSTHARPVRVSYTARKDNSGRWILHRSERALTADPDPEAPQPRLATNLTKVEWTFISDSGRSHENWDSESADVNYATPRIIRLKLTFDGGTDRGAPAPESFDLHFALPVIRKAVS